MADDLHAVADLIGDAFDLAPIEVSDLLKSSPFINMLPIVDSSNGTTHKYVKETGAPVVGFRAANAGRDMDTSDDTLVSIDLKILDFSWQADQAIASAWRKGGKNAYIAREGKRSLKQSFVVFEQQVINGIVGASDSTIATGSASGFAGFRDAATVDAKTDTMVVDATGSTADTASSVWAVRIAEDGVCGVMIPDAPFELGETVTMQRVVNPGTDNKTLPTWYTPGFTWLGLQVGSIYDIGRICNLTAQSGKTLTDDHISLLLSKFPVGFAPTHLLMSRRSRQQLQDSRSATNGTGAPAPFPVESFGVPIITTDAISNTEEILA
jgi:major capsid protein gp7